MSDKKLDAYEIVVVFGEKEVSALLFDNKHSEPIAHLLNIEEKYMLSEHTMNEVQAILKAEFIKNMTKQGAL